MIACAAGALTHARSERDGRDYHKRKKSSLALFSLSQEKGGYRPPPMMSRSLFCLKRDNLFRVAVYRMM